MPTVIHETLVALFRSHPAALLEMLRTEGGVRLAPVVGAVTIADATLPQQVPPARACDLIFEVGHGRGPPTSVIVEVQVSEPGDQVHAWPLYYFMVRARTRGDVRLVVVAASRSIAARVDRVLVDAPEAWFRPYVLGPASVPRVTTVVEARRRPEVALLSALLRAGDDDIGLVGPALAAASTLATTTGTLILDVLLSRLSRAALEAMEVEMRQDQHEYQSDFARKYFSQGRRAGRVDAVLQILARRGLAATDDQRTAISAIDDLERLDTLIARSLTVATVAELLAT